LTDFATSLKHKRQEFGIADLIGSLDVEENARAKNIRGKKIIEGNSSAHVVQKILKTPIRKNSNKNSNKITLHLLRRRRIRKRKIVSLVAKLSIMLRIVWMASRSPRRNLHT
jgi:5-methylcytosine-specific restriction endonuclease McrBC regulatory subunit McrC